MLDAGALRKGLIIELEGKLYQIIEYHHLKLGRGSAQVRLKLKNIPEGNIIERTFPASEKFSPARLEYRPAQFLYEEGGIYYFMDKENFEQVPLSKEKIEGALPFLKEGMELELLTYDERVIGIELPVAVELKVIETGPAFKGDTATAGSKPARLETGTVIQVPLFINSGDIIKVDTRTGEYIERVG